MLGAQLHFLQHFPQRRAILLPLFLIRELCQCAGNGIRVPGFEKDQILVLA